MLSVDAHSWMESVNAQTARHCCRAVECRVTAVLSCHHIKYKVGHFLPDFIMATKMYMIEFNTLPHIVCSYSL